MGWKILTMSLVLVMVLPFTACGDGAEVPSAQEIIDGATQALDDIRTYEFEMDTTLDMAGEAEGETFEMSMRIVSSGALDLDNRKIGLNMAINVAIPEEDEAEMAIEAYIIDNMGDVMMDAPGTDPTWEKEEVSETDWEEVIEVLSMAKLQVELLESAEVEVIGSEKVQGVDCYVLQVTLDMAQLWETVMEQSVLGFGGEMGLPELTEEILDASSYSFSFKQWIAKDTYFLTKVEIDMSIELTAEAMEVEEGEASIDSTMTMLAYNYNQPVSIELPPEAEEAIEY
jgi:hypothetical protein